MGFNEDIHRRDHETEFHLAIDVYVTVADRIDVLAAGAMIGQQGGDDGPLGMLHQGLETALYNTLSRRLMTEVPHVPKDGIIVTSVAVGSVQDTPREP